MDSIRKKVIILCILCAAGLMSSAQGIYYMRYDSINVSGKVRLKDLYIDSIAAFKLRYSLGAGGGTTIDTTSLSNRINAKQNAITLTTTGTSGVSTLSGSTLNIPNYQGQLTIDNSATSGGASLIGNTLYIPNYGVSATWGGIFSGTSISASASVTIPSSGPSVHWVFNGTTGTWTLPAISPSNGNRAFFIKNAGSGNLTISRSGTDAIYTTSSGTTATILPGQSMMFLSSSDTWYAHGVSSSGTVSTVSVVSANGISGTVANATTTPAITLSLGAITPTSVAATGTVTGSNLSGTNTGDQTITLTGDVTGTGTGSFATTIGANKVTLGQMAQVATGSILGRTTAGTGNVEALTATQAKTVLSLNNVDNTSDANKPVSTATQTALNLKANLAGPTFTGTVTLPSTTTIGTYSGLLKGTSGVLSAATAGTDYQAPITLTTTGTSGSASLVGNTLNIPNYGAASGFSNPMTTLGDLIYGAAGGTATRLGGNTTTTKNFLTSTGSAGAATAPTWGALASGDITTALGYTPYNATNPNGYTSNTGTVTSVGGTGTVSGLTLSGTVTTSGNLTLGGTLAVTPSNFASQAANSVLIAPNGAAGVPTFRTLLAADIPTLNQNTTGSAASFTGSLAGDVTGTQSATVVGKINGVALSGLATGILKNTTTTGVPSIAVAGTDYQAPISLTTTGSSGAATFSSNTLNIPNYTLTGLGGFANPMTTAGDIIYGGTSGAPTRLAGNTTTAKQFLTSTGTGTVANAPAFSALSSGDVTTALGFTPYNATNPNGYTSNTGTVTSVGGTGTVSGLTLSGTVTTSGNLTLGGTLAVTPSNFSSQTANLFLASPNGASGVPSFRSIVAADIPTLNQNTTGSAASFTGSLSGDVTGTQGATVVGKINGTSLAGLATGILKNTTSTGVPSIAVAGTDYQAPLTLTTTGTSGAATLVGNTLNIPNYATGGGSGITTLNTLTDASQSFATSTTGTDFTISSATGVHTFNLPDASSTARGLVSTGAQTFLGTKQFSSSATFTNTGSNIYIGSQTASVNLTTASYLPSGQSSINLRSALGGGSSSTTITASAPSAGILLLGGVETEASTGTHPWTAGVYIKPKTVTNAAGATTDAATLMIEGPTLGTASFTNSHSLWVRSGTSRFEGDISVNGNITGTIAQSNVTNLTSDLASKQGTLTLTTTGTSGAATLVGNTLNIPNYATGGSPTWGSITGTLSSQTDLNTALSGKQPNIQFQDNGTNEGTSGGISTVSLNGYGVSAANSSGTLTYSVRHFDKQRFHMESEFLENSRMDGLLSVVSGTSAGVNIIGTESAGNRPGTFQWTTGTTATGRAYLGTATSAFQLGGAPWSVGSAWKINAASTSTDRYQFATGLMNTNSAANQTNGVYFLYDEGGVSTGSAASANWQCVTVNNSVRTFTTTTTAVAIGSYTDLRIEINAAGTSVGFYINDVLVATHTTNIPTAATRQVGWGSLLIKSVGTTASTVNGDYMYVEAGPFTTPR